MTPQSAKTPHIEWPTLAVLAATYALWAVFTSVLWGVSPTASTILTGFMVAQYSSLQHEALHGHPFRTPWLNEMIVSMGITLTVPYGRFRDTHLAHHHDPILTDPYDDPESNYVDPADWARIPAALRLLRLVNNTLLGRMVVGPVIGSWQWLSSEFALIHAGHRDVRRDWALHLLGLIPVVAWLWWADMPWWAYGLSAWIGHGLLKVRTFLEHRAHTHARARSVIVEDNGPLALLFLNNNYHAVHHMHPGVAWYRLPRLYLASRDHYLRHNDGYVYTSYWPIFRAFLVRTKDPVPHPLMDQTSLRNVGVSPELSKNGTPG